MNNSKIISNLMKVPPLGTKERLDLEVGLSNASQVLEAIKQLKETSDYWVLQRFVWNPSMEVVKRRIDRNIKDLGKNAQLEREIIQDQSFLLALEKTDLDKLEEIYKTKVEGLKVRLNSK